MNTTLGQLADLLSGRILSGREDLIVSGEVHTDSRKKSPGSLFFALSGERFDGNSFAAQALENGASIVVVSREIPDLPENAGVLLVKDTLAALQALAKWWRSQLSTLRVVAITGSNGKTSTKDFTKSVLSRKYRTIATTGNLNNHIGVPLSILAATEQDEVAVWEMGMSHPGELAPLCDMIQPQIGLITNIGLAHIEFMGSRDSIAQEKTTLGRCLPPSGILAYPAQDDYADYIARNTNATPLPTGGEQSSIQAKAIQQTETGSSFILRIDGAGEVSVSLPVPGRHMIQNALLAAVAGHTLGLSLDQIASGLEGSVLTSGRLRQFSARGCLVLDDTYNANPDSMVAALDTLKSLSIQPGARRIAVLGKMGELGDFSDEGHARVGRHAAQLGIDFLVVIGEEAAEIARAAKAENTRTQILSSSKHEASTLLNSLLRDGDAFLFKGSRSAAIEEIMFTIFPPEK